ncbi:MAG: AAA-like domain-containing protein [Lachnospiraceae bacterium]|nr:AAA-like domain-containing protein [Lachnospiraceae bacterium]
MSRYFNAEGACNAAEHYMVNLDERIRQIKELVDRNKYFTINRARQYGKTTLLGALAQYLRQMYLVIELDFQLLSHGDFETEKTFTAALARELLLVSGNELCIAEKIKKRLELISEQGVTLSVLFLTLSEWCAESPKPIVLMIDEVDSATNNQVFLDFLSQLRGYYIHRKKRPTFQSVILAGVYDIKNLKQKISDGSTNKVNSPWNIAADFPVDLSFSAEEIAGMLHSYEIDYQTGMHVSAISELLYNYTAGYPYLVSRLCQIMDERLPKSSRFPNKKAAWTTAGVLEAVKLLLAEQNPLFDSLLHKLEDFPQLKQLLYALLFTGQTIVYNADDAAISTASMFGFIKNQNGNAVVANRIFETRLYNMFLTASEIQSSDIYKAALQDKNQFIRYGHLDMDLILERFVTHFNDLYGDQPDRFEEEDGRRYFLLYLRPIINGTGNYYIESRTRNMRRTDVIVDYHGEQFVVEMKIWRGNEYNNRGEQQLIDYLDYYHIQKRYMVSFNFNKNKQIGVKQIRVGDKLLVEAVI